MNESRYRFEFDESFSVKAIELRANSFSQAYSLLKVLFSLNYVQHLVSIQKIY